jgi:uncharacterized membrane protein
MPDSLFFGEEEQKQIIAAIQEAEKQTSGEVKVHIEKKCKSADVLDRAKEVFGLLEMHATGEQNGVLFYLAYEDRKFAVLGDKGINEKVPAHFWNTEGLCAGIKEAGLQLKTHFPYRSDDVNELPDEISFG